MLKTARNQHQSGELTSAAHLYRKIIKTKPEAHQALDGLGIIYVQLNQADKAISLLRAAVKLNSSNSEYYYHLGQAHAASGDYKSALKHYEQATKITSNEADYYFELGNTYGELGDSPSAILAFRAALKYAPNDVEAHNNLANFLATQAKYELACTHFERALTLDPNYLDAYLNFAQARQEMGDTLGAIKLCQLALAREPNYPEIYLRLARYQQMEPQLLKEALENYHTALTLQAESIPALSGIANVLLKLDEPKSALPVFRHVLTKDKSARAYLGLSHCLIRLHQFQEAKKVIEKALKLFPKSAEAHLNLGICLQTDGTFPLAIKAHRKALALQPHLTDAAYHLAVIDQSALTSTGFKASLGLLKTNKLTLEKQTHLQFALGKIYEKQGKYKRAFKHFKRANSIKAEMYPFDATKYQDHVIRIIRLFTKEFFRDRKNFGLKSDSPIFIIGMPRSGSSLLEQILCRHSKITGIGEHREIREIIHTLPQILETNEAAPECMRSLTRQQSVQLARRYLDSRPFPSRDTDRVVDKMLGNVLRLGLIALLFPNARIIHCQRDAMDTCLSCHTQDFATGLRFTTKLESLGLAYRGYLKLMDHWYKALPLQIITIKYEDVILHNEQTVRHLIHSCGLEWEQACLSPHNSNNRIATASYWQARQEIYKHSLNKWRRYESHLRPLRDALDGRHALKSNRN